MLKECERIVLSLCDEINDTLNTRREMGQSSKYLVMTKPIAQLLIDYINSQPCKVGSPYNTVTGTEICKYKGLIIITLDDTDIYWRIG